MWASSSPSKTLNRAKRQAKGKFNPSVWPWTSISSLEISMPLVLRHGGPNWDSHHCSQILRPSESDGITAPVFLMLHPAHGRLWDFPASLTMWAKSYESPLLCTSLQMHPVVLFLWGTPTVQMGSHWVRCTQGRPSLCWLLCHFWGTEFWASAS